MGLSRTREFFSTGGFMLGGEGTPLSRKLAGMGLAAAVLVVPIQDYGAQEPHADPAAVSQERPPAALPSGDAEGHAPSASPFLVAFDLAMALPIATSATAGDFLDAAREIAAKAKQTHTFGDYEVPHLVAFEIVRAARDTGFPPETLMAIVEKESSFDVYAESTTSSATGLTQFLDQTWLEAVRDHGAEFGLEDEAAAVRSRRTKKGEVLYIEDAEEERRVLDLRFVPYLACVLAVRRLQEARQAVEARTGSFEDEDIYLPHFLGTNGAGKLIEASADKPKAVAAKVFPAAARANRGMFRAGGRQLTVRQFHTRARAIIADRIGKYRGVEDRLEIPAAMEPRDESLETASLNP